MSRRMAGIKLSLVYIWSVYIILHLQFILFTNSQIASVGKCPEKTVNQSISLRKLAGTWYEIERSPSLTEFPLKCVNVNLLQFFNGEATVKFNSINRFTKKKLQMPGKAKAQPNARLTGKFLAIIPDFPQYTVHVLATDYETYGIIWACINYEANFHSENLWVFGRRRRLTEEVQNIVSDAVKNFGLTHLKLQPSPQKGCK